MKSPKRKISPAAKSETDSRFNAKKLIFTGAMLATPFFLILILECMLRIAGYGEDLRLFVPTPDKSSRYYGINLRVAQRYVSYLSGGFEPLPIKDLFLKKKPENGYRIFVLGESTTAGFPYGNNVSFARFLHRRLVDAFPDRQIEVVNTSISSVNTFTLLDFTDEILKMKPDALLIYAGHNEYYGPFGPASKVTFGNHRWAVKTVLSLQRFKTFILLRKAALSVLRHTQASETANLDKPSDTAFINKVSIPFGSPKYRQGLDQYRKNLEEIVRKARKRGVPVLLSELICNIRDQAPFPSIADTLSRADRAFQDARKLETDGLYPQAREAYFRAKDLDPIRFRAPEGFNEIVHQIGEKFDIPIVPMKTVFENASPHGLIGDNLLLDHVHPDFKGYSLMAEAFYRTMQRENLIEERWPDDAAKSFANDRNNWGFTPLDSIHASLIILNLENGWPFTTESFSSITAQSVIEKFQPKTVLDSIALETIKNPDYPLQIGHIDLAKQYERKGDFNRAFAEYKSLIYTIPGVDMSYQDAVAFLFRIKDYERARRLLDEARKYNPSAFIYKWLGNANLLLGRMRDGIVFLRQANEIDPKDLQILSKLARACFQIMEFERGNERIAAYEKLAPNDPELISLKRFRESLKSKTQNAYGYLNKARSSMEAKNPGQAVIDLQRAIEIHETGMADEMMGILMMGARKPDQAALYFGRARQLTLKDKPESLNYLTLAYLQSSQFDNASQSFALLKKTYPASPYVNKLESLMEKAGGMDRHP